MADNEEAELVVPVVAEELQADAVAVQTGSVRVVKHVEGHEEILQQELRRGRVEVKRVKTNRVVDGPEGARRLGDTLVIPVVSEVLRVTKEWVVTEEIHVTQIEERETVEQRVQVNHEVAEVQRRDDTGRVVETITEEHAVLGQGRPLSRAASGGVLPSVTPTSTRKVLVDKKSLLRD